MQFDNTALDTRSQFAFTEALAPAATAAASAVEQAFTPVNAPRALKATDHVVVSGPGSGNNVAVGGARINATGQVVIQFVNPTAGGLTHAAGNFVVKITRV